MRFTLSLFAVLAAALPAAAGGTKCQVSRPAVPTPGMLELVAGSETDPLAKEDRLTWDQADRLAAVDADLRKALADVAERRARLPQPGRLPQPARRDPSAAGRTLPEVVERALALQVRDGALVIDPEQSGDFSLARAEGMKAWRAGAKEGAFCAICCAVRAGMETAFRWNDREFGELTAEQAKEAAELARLRQELRAKWVAALKKELTAKQLEWLGRAQERWLHEQLRLAVVAALAGADAATCASCEERFSKKCTFCAIVAGALPEARRQVER